MAGIRLNCNATNGVYHKSMSTALAPMPESYDNEALIKELEPASAEFLDRHLSLAQPWYPHEFVPWSRGRDYVPGQDWEPQDFPLPEAVRSSLFVNLLTEDNLPYYTNTILGLTDADHPLNEWTRRWTAEERRHSEVIGGWIHVTGAIDPRELEDARMVQMGGGQVPQFDRLAEALVYTSLQEPATRIAHHNTGSRLSQADKVGQKIMNRVAGDEGLHTRFYRDLAQVAFKVDPSSMVIATQRQIKGFAMPGTGIPGFAKHAKVIAEAGIYDIAQFQEKVVTPTLEKYWGFWELSDLTPEAEAARDNLHTYLERLARVIRRQRNRQAEQTEPGT